MKKVLFVTYYWPPSGGAGVQRALKFVKFLPEFGIEPVVLTVDEKYATYPLIDSSLLNEVRKETTIYKTKSFEALKILSLFSGKEKIPHGGFANTGKDNYKQKLLRFIRGNLFIPDARKGWVKFAVSKAVEIIKKENIDTVIISSPPHSSQMIGIELKKRINFKWIADMRDPWTDIYFYKDMLHTKFSARRDSRLEAEVLLKADDVISVSSDIDRLFKAKVPDKKANTFHVIPNGFDEEDFTGVIKPLQDKFYITYAGSIAESYKPDVFFRVLSRLRKEFTEVTLGIRIIGSQVNSVRKVIDANMLGNVTEYISYVDHEEAIKYMRLSAVLLLLIPDVPNSKGILTGKMFEYLASRRPIIGLGPSDGDAARIIEECKAGKMFDRSQEDALYAYLKSLFLQYNENGEVLPVNGNTDKYSRKELSKKLSEIILKYTIHK